MMTVRDLIEELQGLDPQMEVRFASQPSWPFEYSIANVFVDDRLQDDGEMETTFGTACYLIEGVQLGYLPDNVKEAIGW